MDKKSGMLYVFLFGRINKHTRLVSHLFKFSSLIIVLLFLAALLNVLSLNPIIHIYAIVLLAFIIMYGKRIKPFLDIPDVKIYTDYIQLPFKNDYSCRYKNWVVAHIHKTLITAVERIFPVKFGYFSTIEGIKVLAGDREYKLLLGDVVSTREVTRDKLIEDIFDHIVSWIELDRTENKSTEITPLILTCPKCKLIHEILSPSLPTEIECQCGEVIVFYDSKHPFNFVSNTITCPECGREIKFATDKFPVKVECKCGAVLEVDEEE